MTTGDAAIVRDAGPEDVPAAQRIYAHYVEQTTASFEETPPDVAEMARRRDAVLAAGLPYLVADRQGDVVGFGYGSAFRPRPAYRNTVENSVYVAPHARGHGVGQTLLQALIVRCEAAGYRQMVAVIGGVDNTASIRLHAKLGFREVGRMPEVGHKFGTWVDVVLLQRALGRPSPSSR